MKSVLERIAENLVEDGDCLRWTGYHTPKGYGKINVRGQACRVHRVVWEETVGPISDGLTLDHLCGVKDCCHPDHLEAVTAGINTLRGDTASGRNSRKTHCLNGHPFDDANTYIRSGGGRYCRACACERASAHYYRNKP